MYRIILALLIILGAGWAWGENIWDETELFFDDAPRPRIIEHPEWFKESFLNFPEDLQEVREQNKKGLILYFGQTGCAYCKKLMEVNFGKPDIAQQTRDNFEVIALDIWGDREVTDLQGEVMTEKEFSLRNKTRFTPSLIFYDSKGREALRLRGYYPPYKFRAALDYVLEEYYQKESFRRYLQRADPPPKFDLADMNDEVFFTAPPYWLDRSRVMAQKPLLVFFEQTECHACDILHGVSLMQDRRMQELLSHFEVIQLNMWADTPVVTPGGQKITARQWAKKLDLIYAPSLVFFDQYGNEVFRVDSVVNLYRLRAVLEFIRSGDYRNVSGYLRWRRMQTEKLQ